MSLPHSVHDTDLPNIGNYIRWSPIDDAHARGGYGAVFRGHLLSDAGECVVAIKVNRLDVQGSWVSTDLCFESTY